MVIVCLRSHALAEAGHAVCLVQCLKVIDSVFQKIIMKLLAAVIRDLTCPAADF
jgi:hypothetical protein